MRNAVSVQMQLKSEMLEQLLAATAEVRQLVAQVERPLGRATAALEDES